MATLYYVHEDETYQDQLEASDAIETALSLWPVWAQIETLDRDRKYLVNDVRVLTEHHYDGGQYQGSTKPRLQVLVLEGWRAPKLVWDDAEIPASEAVN